MKTKTILYSKAQLLIQFDRLSELVQCEQPMNTLNLLRKGLNISLLINKTVTWELYDFMWSICEVGIVSQTVGSTYSEQTVYKLFQRCLLPLQQQVGIF